MNGTCYIVNNTTYTTESLSCFGIVTIAALTRFLKYNTSLATLRILRCNVFHTRTLTLLQIIRAKEHLCKINDAEPTSVSTEVDSASALSFVSTKVAFLRPTHPPVPPTKRGWGRGARPLVFSPLLLRLSSIPLQRVCQRPRITCLVVLRHVVKWWQAGEVSILV